MCALAVGGGAGINVTHTSGELRGDLCSDRHRGIQTMSLTEGQKGRDKQGKEERKSWEGGRRGVQNEEKGGGLT